jgi:hypothetical protein
MEPEWFNTVFTRALHWSVSWAISIQSTPSHPISLRSILILSTHLRTYYESFDYIFFNTFSVTTFSTRMTLSFCCQCMVFISTWGQVSHPYKATYSTIIWYFNILVISIEKRDRSFWLKSYETFSLKFNILVILTRKNRIEKCNTFTPPYYSVVHSLESLNT